MMNTFEDHIRQQFAEAALTGWLATWNENVDPSGVRKDKIAEFCWDVADAMMAEQKRRYGEPSEEYIMANIQKRTREVQHDPSP